MHRFALLAPILALAALGVPATPALAAASTAKVVIVVGPVADHNAHYIADAKAIAAEARRYTSNVVVITTPNATWARVSTAAQGASVFVYLGHGNGWPSPYPPFQTATQDGIGVDPVVGANGRAVVYYGEDYIRANIRLAPNAVVLLYHLCYASGNAEPGRPAGTPADARARVDNFGAGFIGAGARAVFAEGHPAHPVSDYIRQLFTTNRTMGQIFRAAPTFHGHVMGPFASQRTPGLTYEMDPEAASSSFYRSLVGDLALTATEVRRAPPASTGLTPSGFVVPGAAEVTAASGASLFASAAAAANPAGHATGTLTHGTRLRITGDAPPAADGTRILAVTVLGGKASGFVRSPGIAPRDSAATVAWSIDQSAARLSPNRDGTSDAFVLAVRASESARSSLTVRNAAGTVVWSSSATGDIVRFAWDLRTSTGSLVRDGRYSWSFSARDAWGNAGISRSGSFTTDATPPATRATASSSGGRSGWSVSAVRITLTAKDALSGVAGTWWRVDGGPTHRYSAPAVVTGDGTRTVSYRSVDQAGIAEAWHTLNVKIDTTPPSITAALSGTAGLAAATWRSAVTIKPKFADGTSGIATRTAVVDGAAPVQIGSTPLVVGGDGAHTVVVRASDLAGNESALTSSFTIDTTPPVVDLPHAPPTPPVVTPNGDGATEKVVLPYAISEGGALTATVTAPDGKTVVRTLAATVGPGSHAVTWDGRNASGGPVPDGRYTVTFRSRDLAGNPGDPVGETVDVYAALASVTRSPALFFPQDGDTLAPRAVVSYRLLAPAAVTITVVDAAGHVVRAPVTEHAYRAGAQTWSWNGKADGGTYVPQGRYRIIVLATNGTQTATVAVAVDAMAFRLAATSPTAVRGKSFTLTAVSAEPLAAAPTLVVRQPGIAAWTVTMTRTSSTRWTASIRPRAGGSAGAMTLTVRGIDTGRGRNTGVLRLALR